MQLLPALETKEALRACGGVTGRGVGAAYVCCRGQGGTTDLMLFSLYLRVVIRRKISAQFKYRGENKWEGCYHPAHVTGSVVLVFLFSP